MPPFYLPFSNRAEHGEGPVWDAERKRLYWVDIIQGRYYRGDLEKGKAKAVDVGQPLGVLALREKKGLVMGVRDGMALWRPKKHRLRLLQGPKYWSDPDFRFNDGAVDPRGRFVAGTMSWEGDRPEARLYRLDPDRSVHILEEGLTISNGLGWSPAEDTFFLIDTPTRTMFAYDYDPDTGDIADRRTFIQFAEDELPDGMCIDTEGGFWVAIWGGAKVVHFDAKGKRVEELELPVPHPTSCCFGGAALQTLFVTTSQIALSDREKNDHPLAGRVFAFELEATGQPQGRFRG